MDLKLELGTVLDASAEALIVAVDDSTTGFEGNVALQCRRRWGACWEDVLEQLELPVPLGAAAFVRCMPPIPFRVLFAASILDHLNRFEHNQYPALLKRAFRNVCETGRRLGVTSFASSLLKGGWRMDYSRAFCVMAEVLDEFRDFHATFNIHSASPEHHDKLRGLARSMGFRDI